MIVKLFIYIYIWARVASPWMTSGKCEKEHLQQLLTFHNKLVLKHCVYVCYGRLTNIVAKNLHPPNKDSKCPDDIFKKCCLWKRFCIVIWMSLYPWLNPACGTVPQAVYLRDLVPQGFYLRNFLITPARCCPATCVLEGHHTNGASVINLPYFCHV